MEGARSTAASMLKEKVLPQKAHIIKKAWQNWPSSEKQHQPDVATVLDFVVGEIKILNVLVIDDNEMTRSLLRTILNHGGYKVVGEASSGMAGLEQVIKLTPHIVCLDIMMPDSDGIEVLKQIMAQLPKTIVLMVTGKRDMQTVKVSLELGAKGYIVKPFNAATVLQVVKDAVLRTAEQAQPKK